MERTAISQLAGPHDRRRAARRVRRLRLSLVAVAQSRYAWLLSVAGLSSAGAAGFLAVALRRRDAFQTDAYDLGFFDQIIFNTARGRWFETSFLNYNFLGQHFQPILLFYAGAYRLGAGVPFLLITQAIVAAAAAIPLAFACRAFGMGKGLALAFAAAYLLNPYLHRAINFDFHPEVMVALPVFLALWAVARDRFALAMTAALAALLLKEDAAFVVLALSAVMWWRGSRREAVAAAAIAIFWATIVVLVVMPAARNGQPSDLVERYSYLAGGDMGSGLIGGLAAHPVNILQVLFAPAQLWTGAVFLAVTAPLALWRPWTLLGVIPGLVLALLSSHSAQQQLELQYAVELVPIALTGVVVATTGRLGRIHPSGLAAGVLGPALIGFAVLSPLAPWHAVSGPPTQTHREAVLAGLALVPANPAVSVSAQSGLLPRVSERDEVYEFPSHARDVDWVVLDSHGSRSTQSIAAGFDAARATLSTTDTLVYANDGVEVYRRNQ